MKINKETFIDRLSKRAGIEKIVCREVLNEILNEIVFSLQRGDEVSFAGFGNFIARYRHARKGVNPLNPVELIDMPATIVPKFKAGQKLKQLLKPLPENQN